SAKSKNAQHVCAKSTLTLKPSSKHTQQHAKKPRLITSKSKTCCSIWNPRSFVAASSVVSLVSTAVTHVPCVRSVFVWACCLAHTAAHCSHVVKPRHWLLPHWAPSKTSKSLTPSWASRVTAS